ncbi:MAG TPA: c-type cytochrome domain-containing protein, partial [Ktedonobacterales bacterium]|nr:c-type cytochrome domain-containing protein [Ktedonobacterales bacterium]
MRLAVGLVIAGLAVGSGSVGAAGQDAANPAFYTQRVKPIFAANCYRCHGGMNRRGGLSMETRAGMMKGGKDGLAVVPGDPEKSLLVRMMRRQGSANDLKPMPPPPRPKLSDSDIATVEQWVRA